MIRKTLPKKPSQVTVIRRTWHLFSLSQFSFTRSSFRLTRTGLPTLSRIQCTHMQCTHKKYTSMMRVCVYINIHTHTHLYVCVSVRVRVSACVCVYSCIQVLCLIIPVYIFPVYIECTHHDTWKYIPWMYRDDIDESRCFIVHEHLDTIFPRHHLELTPLVPTHDWAIGSSSLSERETW